MNIEQLYKDYNIPYATEGHKHCRPGWVNTVCPFCVGENPGLHLGYNIEKKRFHCWRCQGHQLNTTLSKLLNTGKRDTAIIIKDYGLYYRKPTKTKQKVKIKSFKYPSNLVELQNNHRKYLIKRNFNPDRLINEWNLMGSSVFSILDHINYKHRIIIPFTWEGRVVSFDSRDITNKSKFKYMACPEKRELVPHKDILYGREEKWGKFGICVEGPTDVWRMGFNSFATSGITYTFKQLRLIANTFTRVAVVFDNEPQAIKQANKLVADLKFRKVDAFRVNVESDPGSMLQKDADYLVKQLI